MTTSPILSLPYLLPQQAQKHVTVNEALQRLDALVQISVASRSLASPPPSPAEGDRYIGASGATGDWAGFDGQLIVWSDGAWVAYLPQTGWTAWADDDERLIVYNGTDWVDVVTAFDRLGVNTTADGTNRLAVKSDASLLDHDGSDHRLKINKATATDTATLAFQSDFTTHAELGLAGQDTLSVKVSGDGITFKTALSFTNDGLIGAGTDTPASQLHIKQDFDTRLTIDTATAGAGGGFDIINSAENQNWRVTGQPDLLKFRDHTALIDKFILKNGSTGDAIFTNFGNLGVGTTTPSARLTVAGAVRVGNYTLATLPSAAANGSGALIFVTDTPGGANMAYSDGTSWRRVSDKALI